MLFAFGKDIIDILLVAILMYQAYKLMRNTGAINIFFGIMIFVVIWFLIVKVLKLGLTGAILNQVISVGALALVVLFQNEIYLSFPISSNLLCLHLPYYFPQESFELFSFI